jgi:membrane fusion protein, multidrug efflux system
VASAQAQLGLARSQLATARDRSGNQIVTASTSGIVSEKSVSTGAVVTPGMPLFTIVDLATLQLEATVPSDAIGQINVGSPVDLEVRGYAGERFLGTIRRIAPSVDAATGQVRVYVSILNPGKRLVGGLFAEGTVRSVSQQALVVPIEALDESGNTPSVMRVRNGMVERVTVQLGMRNEGDGIVQILSGLGPGDLVLIGPARTLTPGAKVRIG